MSDAARAVQGELDYDWLIVGSGFGGSVSALRLSERGQRVAVIEAGRRWADSDFPTSAWHLRRYLWAPRLGLRGFVQYTNLSHAAIVSGVGVGGGSLAYANALYVPGRSFFTDPQWADLADWERELAPHYATAERMLGVATYDEDDPASELLRSLGRHLGVEGTYHRARVGVFLGTPGKRVPDPYFDGAGPDRVGCNKCGDCMIGCRLGAKNTLVKNYLWLAERAGAAVLPEREVVDIEPLGGSDADGSVGYAVTIESSTARLRRQRRTVTARGVVVAAGSLGTTRLLHQCRERGGLSRISDRVGSLVRTNAEHVPAVLLPHDHADISRRVTISSSLHPSDEVHVETLTYGRNADLMSSALTPLTPLAARGRWRLWLCTCVRRPGDVLKTLRSKGRSRREVILLFMGTGSGALRLTPTFGRSGRSSRAGLRSHQDPEQPVAASLQLANDAARWLADHTGGVAQSPMLEALRNVATTAHPLGGAVIGRGPETGVVDTDHRVFGYRNLLVCDGSVVPANLGTNPSLTITALTERAMQRLAERESSD